MRRWLTRLHDLLAFSALVVAAVQLAQLPNAERWILFFFIPPLIAGAFLLANRGDPFFLAACRLFLSMIAIAVTVAEVTLALPVPKPQFPGMPLLADRILVAYLVAYGLFLWILCPAYVLTTWLRDWWQVMPRSTGRGLFLLTAWACWLIMMLKLTAAAVIARGRFF